MIKDSINHGESYSISAQAQDADGVAIVMDGTWTVACRVVSKKTGQTVLENLDMPIAAGVATIEIDSGSAPWAPGVYLYDTRITDPDGKEFWSDPVQLTIETTITPKSA